MYASCIEEDSRCDLFKRLTSSHTAARQGFIVGIKARRAQIRQMLFKEIQRKIRVDDKPKQSFTLQDLIKSMGKYFFGEYGKLTASIPYLEKEYVRLRKIRRLQFHQKINVGDLTYLNINCCKRGEKSRLDEVKKGYFTRSAFFFVPKQESDYLNSHNPLTFNLKPKQKAFKFDTTYCNETKPMHSSARSDSIHCPSKSMSYKGMKLIQTQYLKRNRQVIDSKLDAMSQTQSKLEKRLFKLIDKASMSAKNQRIINKGKDHSIKLLLTKRAKYQKPNSKEMYLGALKAKDSYSMMNPIKAKLLQLSDSIHNSNNETALAFAENILTEYQEHSKKVNDYFIRNTMLAKLAKVKADAKAFKARRRV